MAERGKQNIKVRDHQWGTGSVHASSINARPERMTPMCTATPVYGTFVPRENNPVTCKKCLRYTGGEI